MASTFPDNNTSVAPSFLSGGGEMGKFTRAFDWTQTSLGHPDTWPQSLRTTLSILLNSRFPMFLFWGEELTCFYNDAYRPSMGNDGKHPSALGKPAAEVWPEIWQIIKPLIDQVLIYGEATWSENQLIPIYRNGKIEDAYWTFSYSPVQDESGKPAGVFVTCTETTDAVKDYKSIEESEERFRTMAEGTDVLIAVADDSSQATYFNKAWTDLTGRPMEDLLSFGWLDLVHPDDQDNYMTIYLTAFKKRVPFVGEFRILNREGDYRWLLAKGPPRFHPDGSFAGYISSCIDITDRKETEQKLKETTHLLRSIVDNAPFPIGVYTGKEMLIELANKSIIDVFGKGQDVVGKRYAELLPELAGQEIFEQLDAVYTTGIPFHAKTQQVDIVVDGKLQPFYFNYSFTPIYDTDGKIYAVMNTAAELTDIVLTQKKIEESEARFRALADQSPMIVYIVEPNEEATMSYFNKTWLDYTGQTFEEALGRAWDGIVHPDDVQGVMDIYVPAFNKRESYTLPAIRLRRVDGEYRWHIFKGNPRYLANGEFMGYIGVGFDIHEQKLAEDKIRESEKRWQLLADTVPSFVWTANPEGNVIYFNEQWYDYTGLTKEESLDFNWTQVLHPQDLEAGLQQWTKSVKEQSDFEVEARYKGKDGQYRWVLVRAAPVRDAEGNITAWYGSSTDIHDQKTIAEKLEELVNERTMALQRSNDDLQQFAHVASHDLKEPVRKVKYYSSLLQDTLKDSFGERGQHYINKIQKASDRMFTMIEGVLTYSSLSATQQLSIPVDLSSLFKDIQIDLEVAIEERKATIQVGELPTVEGSPVLLYQLFYNLLNNSLKFVKPGVAPEIFVHATSIMEQDKAFARIVIKDNGIGFDPAYAQSIFETFTRLNSKDKYEGTGLGLALCKKIVERHGGTIEAIGEPGKGASFIVNLPVKNQ